MSNAVFLVVIPTALVFVVALIGNLVSFDNRLVNALVTAAVVGIAWLALTLVTQSNYPGVVNVLIAVVVVFITDLIGNLISFTNRFTNALATAILFALLFAGSLYGLAFVLGPNFHGAGGS